MLGFETIGNATLVVHDSVPVLATDPWVAGEPYFGSWTMSHAIPKEQLDHIKRSKYIWFSHGHPDHMNADSLHELSDRSILLPDHVGGRIASYLNKSGFRVQVLPTKSWIQLSPNVRVMCLPDYNQDATLLIAVGENLIVDLNDGAALGYKRFIRGLAQGFKRRYLLALRNYGDADMMNIWDESGSFLPPEAAAKPSVGRMYEKLVKDFDGTHALPFSCFHRYQRADSCWASQYATPLSAHFQGYHSATADLLPAFVRVDFQNHSVTELNPPENPLTVKEPGEFGDNWSDLLERDELARCERYFKEKAHLVKTLGFINLRIGGKDHVVDLNPKRESGITFEAPRNSFVKAVKWQIFDDLLIGNYMRTTLHGLRSLYQDFTPYVAKYADNGLAQTEDELRSYFQTYRERSTAEYFLARFHFKADAVVRRYVDRNSATLKFAKRIYLAVT